MRATRLHYIRTIAQRPPGRAVLFSLLLALVGALWADAEHRHAEAEAAADCLFCQGFIDTPVLLATDEPVIDTARAQPANPIHTHPPLVQQHSQHARAPPRTA